MTQDITQNKTAYCRFVCQMCENPQAEGLFIIPKQLIILCEDCFLRYSRIFPFKEGEFVYDARKRYRYDQRNKLSLTANSIPLLIQPLVRCKICKKKATSYFATSSVDGFVLLFCEPCFETLNELYTHEIRQRVEEGTILEDEVED